MAVARYCLHYQADFRTSVSRKTRAIYECKAKEEEDCTFVVKAVLGAGEFVSFEDPVEFGWRVTKSQPHTCTPADSSKTPRQRKVAATSAMLSAEILNMVTDDPGCDMATASEALHSLLGPEIGQASYSMIWRAKRKAITQVYGKDGYEVLGSLMDRLTEKDADTRAAVKKSDDNHYEAYFVAPGPLRRLWRSEHTRKAVSLDAMVTTSPSGGIVYVLSLLDGCQQPLILGFGHATEETEDTWSWFLGRAKESFPGLDAPDCVLFSDQQPALRAAMAATLPSTTHCACLAYRAAALKATAGLKKKSDLVKAMVAMAVEHDKARCLELLQGLPTNAQNFLLKVPLEKWTHSHCPVTRWGLTTTAFGESIGEVLRNIRPMPLLAQLQRFMDKAYALLEAHYQEYSRQAETGEVVGSKVSERLVKSEEEAPKRYKVAAAFMSDGEPVGQVVLLDGQGEDKYSVNLAQRTCSCKDYQQRGIPCIHAVAVAKALNYQPAEYVHPSCAWPMCWRHTNPPFPRPPWTPATWKSAKTCCRQGPQGPWTPAYPPELSQPSLFP